MRAQPPTVSRRGMLGLLAGTALTGVGATGCGSSVRPARPYPTGQDGLIMPIRHSYGRDAAQWGELYLPQERAHAGTVVVIHGGFWRAEYSADLGAPLASDLAQRGWAAWNLEYRRVGAAGGGWPGTLDDVAAGIDHLAQLRQTGTDLDLGRVVVIGHSAGGQLAAWAAGRPGLPSGAPGAAPRVRVTGVVSQAGVLDLARAAREQVGGSAVPDLLGGMPDAVPQRYAQASPQQQLPIHVPVRCVHARDDQNVPYDQSTGYVAAAVAAGDDAGLVTVDGDHFTLIDIHSTAWQAVIDLLPALMSS